VQASTVAVRGVSTTTTGGIGNPVVATGEWIGAIVLSILSLITPVLVVILVFLILVLVVRWVRRKKRENLAGSM
jgi:membrane protein DedA with SNARE-associated domain